jgi:endo-beta-N-acetylglucosaminidase D
MVSRSCPAPELRSRLGRAALAATAVLALSFAPAEASLRPEAPPFGLSVDQLFAWRAEGALSEPANRSAVPLAPRFIDPAPGAGHDPAVRVMFAPDGMNNFGNYLTPQPVFNLYTFTHWSQIDILVWFAGTARQTVNIPARPWIDAAHRNGVKVIGTVFFAPTAWGGSADTVKDVLREDAQGRFPAADRLVAIARYYGFDGWLINQETDVAAEAGLGAKMGRFMAYLTRIAPPPMEIHWYDAMLPDGRVAWQNALTPANAPLLQSGSERVADGIFLNYGWTPGLLRQSAALAEQLGRSRYDLFVGADLWPLRQGAQAAFANSHWLRDMREPGTGKALGSIALFAPNFNYNAGGKGFAADPGKAASFYDGEVRLFAGDERNMAAEGSIRNGAWDGIAALVPARSVLSRLPFETYFNTGHGMQDVRAGVKIGGPWHDMSRQEVLPNWQFAQRPAGRISIGYDFARPYQGGSSLRLVPTRPVRESVEVPLFLAALPLGPATQMEAITSADSGAYAVRLILKSGRRLDFPISSSPAWHRQRWCLGRYAGDSIHQISLILRQNMHNAPLRMGGLSVGGSCA